MVNLSRAPRDIKLRVKGLPTYLVHGSHEKSIFLVFLYISKNPNHFINSSYSSEAKSRFFCNCENKRPMGHIAHRKQFKSINTYDYIITLIKRRKKTLLILGEFIAGSSFEQTWIPFTQECHVQSLVEIGRVVLEK